MKNRKSIAGIVSVEITSAEPEKTFLNISRNGIPVSCIQQKSDLTYQFQISRRDLQQLSALCTRQGSSFSVLHRQGLSWQVSALLKRPVLILGLLLFLISAIFLPSRILFIEVSGNKAIPSHRILDSAEKCGISFGASRRIVRSEKVKNALLSEIPQLQWVGVNTSGCRAVISVRERSNEPQKHEEKFVSNIIAAQDGYILSQTVTRGTAMVQPGETVTKGQLLISGYTDCGFCIQASRAAGEILAQTTRHVTIVIPDSCQIPEKSSHTKYNVSLLFQKKRINLWKDSRISDTDCGRMYEEYFVSLPGGFQLPIAICIDRYIVYDLQDSAIQETDVYSGLQKYADDYLLTQMTAGQILDKQRHMTAPHGVFSLESSYTCSEIIGIEQREQIGEHNGKRN